jgi:hypothetical protein
MQNNLKVPHTSALSNHHTSTIKLASRTPKAEVKSFFPKQDGQIITTGHNLSCDTKLSDFANNVAAINKCVSMTISQVLSTKELTEYLNAANAYNESFVKIVHLTFKSGDNHKEVESLVQKMNAAPKKSFSCTSPTSKKKAFTDDAARKALSQLKELLNESIKTNLSNILNQEVKHLSPEIKTYLSNKLFSIESHFAHGDHDIARKVYTELSESNSNTPKEYYVDSANTTNLDMKYFTSQKNAAHAFNDNSMLIDNLLSYADETLIKLDANLTEATHEKSSLKLNKASPPMLSQNFTDNIAVSFNRTSGSIIKIFHTTVEESVSLMISLIPNISENEVFRLKNEYISFREGSNLKTVNEFINCLPEIGRLHINDVLDMLGDFIAFGNESIKSIATQCGINEYITNVILESMNKSLVTKIAEGVSDIDHSMTMDEIALSVTNSITQHAKCYSNCENIYDIAGTYGGNLLSETVGITLETSVHTLGALTDLADNLMIDYFG